VGQLQSYRARIRSCPPVVAPDMGQSGVAGNNDKIGQTLVGLDLSTGRSCTCVIDKATPWKFATLPEARRTKIGGCVVGSRSIAVAVAGVVIIAGIAVSNAPAATTPKTVTVYTKLAQAALIDVSKPGFSLGDEDIFSDNVFTKNGSSIGTDGGVCTVIRVLNAATRSGTDECLITFSLTRGEITTQDLQPTGQFTGIATGAITGGTGRYRGVHGVYTVRFHGPTAATVTFSLG
jgi:Allene oxide cyclase barrel like domain